MQMKEEEKQGRGSWERKEEERKTERGSGRRKVLWLEVVEQLHEDD